MNIYPESQPFDGGYMNTDDGHALYYERHGNPDGRAALYLHGGPGGGCSFSEYRMFPPDHFNVVMYDQRGSGRSTPYASTHANDIPALVNDIERLRQHCGIESWSVCGGSWGSALAMFYADKHPQRIERMLLRGIFFADEEGADYITEARALPRPMDHSLFKNYSDFIPPEELQKDGLLKAYHKRVNDGDEALAIEAARLFFVMDAALATYEPRQDWIDEANNDPKSTLALSRLWFHYATHHFKAENRERLLQAMGRLQVPVDIIHGLDDKLCPVENARLLHSRCRNSTLTTPAHCGHSQVELPLLAAFLDITNRWRDEDRGVCPSTSPAPPKPPAP